MTDYMKKFLKAIIKDLTPEEKEYVLKLLNYQQTNNTDVEKEKK